MKKQVLGILAALFVFAVLLPVGVYAAADNVYALLYDDGTLVFQHGDTPELGKNVTNMYEVDLSAVYTWDSNEKIATTPWYNERESVRVVNFADKISPTFTAYWFSHCRKLGHIDNIQNLETANVTDMSCMFEWCDSLTALDVSHFDTSNVTNMHGMFYGCKSLKALDFSHFDTSKVTSMYDMFRACDGFTTLDLSHFDTSSCNTVSVSCMFDYCNDLKTIYASEKFKVEGVQNVRMFESTGKLVGGNGTTKRGLPDANHVTYARIDTPSTPGYFTYKPFAPDVYAIADAVAGNETLFVMFSNPGAATLAVSYFDANGQFVSANLQSVQANAGTVTSAVSANATTARVTLFDTVWRPLCGAFEAGL